MFELKCRVEWGCFTPYFDKKYCCEFDFSGNIEVLNGKIKKTEKIEIPFDYWGPYTFSKKFHDIVGEAWESKVCNWMEGIRFTAEVSEISVVKINTETEKVSFNIKDLLEKKHLVFNVGNKYSMAVIHVELDEEDWFLPEVKHNQVIITAKDFKDDNPLVEFFTVKGRLIAPGRCANAMFEYKIGDTQNKETKDLFKIRVRYLINGSSDKEAKARGIAKFRIVINGKEAWMNRKYGMYHDDSSQFLEEVWEEIDSSCLQNGVNTLWVINEDKLLSVVLQSVLFEKKEIKHLAVVVYPQWAIKGKPFSITIRCNTKAALLKTIFSKDEFLEAINPIEVETFPLSKETGDMHPYYCNEDDMIAIGEGEHEFFFVALKPLTEGRIEFYDEWNDTRTTVIIREVWDIKEEEVPVKTGFEIRTGTPDEYLDIIKYAHHTQLGNIAVFRDYHNRAHNPAVLWDAAEYCRKHGIHTDTIVMDQQSTIARASGEYCHCVGTHEFTGIFYGRDETPNTSKTMRDAMNAAVNLLSTVAVNYRIKDIPVAIGDASLGSRYAYMAGFDIIRHETFVTHHALILGNARGSSRAFTQKNWGVHIASQHNGGQPEFEAGIRRYWLGMYLPWVYGAAFLYEEDSMFQNFKCTRMAGEDYLTKGKTSITREFYKYSSTHPREGECRVDIAMLQGRYDAPLAGISGEVCENFTIYGHVGNNDKWEWGYRQPEKGHHLLEVFAPGIYLVPLNQNAGRVRKFFNGNPLGEFDLLPVEASVSVFGKYKFIALLTWHTMEYAVKDEIQRDHSIMNDYYKFMKYVKEGGVLFLSIPHFTTRADRDFIRNMDDLMLYKGGDICDLCGLRVIGKSNVEFSIGEACDKDFLIDEDLDLIRKPNLDKDEDGSCMLADIELRGAEILVKDKASSKPVITRYRLGKGYVYLLCTYAYPGHEKLKTLMPNVLKSIAQNIEKNITVVDKTGEIYWSVWEKDALSGRVYMLNTDWTIEGNEKDVRVNTQNLSLNYSVKEGKVGEIIYFKRGMLYSTDENSRIEIPVQVGENSFKVTIQSVREINFHLLLNKNVKISLPNGNIIEAKKYELCDIVYQQIPETILSEFLLEFK